MDRAWLNAAVNLEYRDPAPFLRRMRSLELKVARSTLPPSIRSLRTNRLKRWRETRDAAIFCVGMGARIGCSVYLARSEAQDYDFVASWVTEDTRRFTPIQLKEVVPTDIEPEASVQKAIDALKSKYVRSSGLTVAIYLNQRIRFDPSAITIPQLNISGLWIFGGLGGSTWGLWGDFLDQPVGTQFEYPA